MNLTLLLIGMGVLASGCSSGSRSRVLSDASASENGTALDASRADTAVQEEIADAGDAASGLEQCPDAGTELPDGTWTVQSRVIESACPGHIVGDVGTRFSESTIITSETTLPVHRDLRLTTKQGELHRGLLRDRTAILDGSFGAATLDSTLYLVFAGACFTAHLYEDVVSANGTCVVHSFLIGERTAGASD